MFQGFSHFSLFFLHNFVLMELATSSIQVNTYRQVGKGHECALEEGNKICDEAARVTVGFL